MRFLSRLRAIGISSNPINIAGAFLLLVYGYVLCNFDGFLKGVLAGHNMSISTVMVLCLVALVYVIMLPGSRAATVGGMLIGAAICGLLVYGFLTYGPRFAWFLIWPFSLAGMVLLLLVLLVMVLKR